MPYSRPMNADDAPLFRSRAMSRIMSVLIVIISVPFPFPCLYVQCTTPVRVLYMVSGYGAGGISPAVSLATGGPRRTCLPDGPGRAATAWQASQNTERSTHVSRLSVG